MKEAFSVIASAWSVALIALFLIMAGSFDDNTGRQDPYLFLFLLSAAVTGTGWLLFRHNVKNPPKPPTEPKSAPEEK